MLMVASSWDGGRSWTNRIDVETLGDERDPSLTCSPDSMRLYLTSFLYDIDSVCTTLVRVSVDDGYSWSNPLTVGPGAITSPIVEHEDGSLLLATYGRAKPYDLYDSCMIWRSVAPDIAWSGPTTLVNGVIAGRHLQEPWVIRLRNGALVAAFRYGNWDRIATSASWDNGVTWSAPAPKFIGTGRPMLIELATGPMICIYRNPTTRAAVWRESLDRGGNWGVEQVMATAPAQMVYAAAVELRPGLAVGLVGLESSDTSSLLKSFYLIND